MNHYGFANKWNLSLNQVRGADKAGYLRGVDKNESDPEQEIRYCLRHDLHLPVRLLVALIEDPSLMYGLGPQQRKAEIQLLGIGNAKEEAAPPGVAACIADRNLNPVWIDAMVRWLRSVIPAEPVSHYWVAARLVFGLPPEKRERAGGVIRVALLKCRAHPDFAGWWTPLLKYGRRNYYYHQPAQMYDL